MANKLARMRLEILPEKRVLGRFPSVGFMDFQFDPETITENHAFKWEYNDAINEDENSPQAVGREARKLSMKLQLVAEGLVERNSQLGQAQTELTNVTNIKAVQESIKALMRARDFHLTSNFAHDQDPLSRGIPRNRLGGLSAPARTVAPSISPTEIPSALTFEERQQQFDLIADLTQLKTTTVDNQLLWLKQMTRPIDALDNRPPKMQLIWNVDDPFTCVLTNLKIVHKRMHPQSFKPLYAEVDITLSEAATFFSNPTRE